MIHDSTAGNGAAGQFFLRKSIPPATPPDTEKDINCVKQYRHGIDMTDKEIQKLENRLGNIRRGVLKATETHDWEKVAKLEKEHYDITKKLEGMR